MKLGLKAMLFLLVVIPLFFWESFLEHFLGHFTGSVTAITQQWHIAVLNIVFFVAFLIPLSFRRKASWGEYGIVTAFFVSLFVEMYGIAFSMIFASNYLFKGSQYMPKELFGFSLLGVYFAMTIGMVYGAIVMIIGMALIGLGWVTLYKAGKGKKLVTTGIYRHSRHPQYLGFILVTLGWFVSWPTLLTLALAPILAYKYFRVSFEEEKEVSKEFPEYEDYASKTPFLI